MKTKRRLISQNKFKLGDMEKTISSRDETSVSFFLYKYLSNIFKLLKWEDLFNNILYHSVTNNYCLLFRHFTFSHTELTQMTSTRYLNYTSMKYAVAQKKKSLMYP